MQSPLTTSPRGLELIRSFEKFEPKAYLCPAGKWTIGYGHVIRQSEPQLRTKTLTRGEAEQLLRADWTRQDPAITRALQSLGRSGVPVYVLYLPGKQPVVLSELLSKSEVLDALKQI